MSILINGNNITFTGLSELDVIVQIQRRKLADRQFSGMGQPDGSVHMTFPMNALERGEFAAHIHRRNNEILKANPHLDPKGPNGKPPTGGTPGAARAVKFTNTVAIAA